MATAAKRTTTWPLPYQLRVNALIMDLQLRPVGTGRLMTAAELDELERAAAAGEPAESFVARVIAADAPRPALTFHGAQRALSRVLTEAEVAHTVTRPQLVRHREEDR